MGKIGAFWNLLRAGQSVADPAKWKSRTNAVNGMIALVAAIVGLGKVFGFDYNLSADDLAAVGAGIVGVVSVANSVMCVVTSDKVGFLPPLDPADAGTSDRGS